MRSPTLRTFEHLWGRIAGWVQHITYREHVPALVRADRVTVVEAPTESVVDRFQMAAKWAGIIGIVAGYHVFIGWCFDIPVLKSPGPSFGAMHVTGAVCAAACGLGLYLLQARWVPASPTKTAIVSSCAWFSVLIGLLSLLESIFGWKMGIDYWPIRQGYQSGAPFETDAGPMTLASAAGFTIIGLSLALLDGLRTYRVGEVLAVIAAALSMLALTSYFYGAEQLPQQMTVYASAIMLVLSAGLLCARPDRGFMAKITSNSFGGIMARRLLPATLLIPIILGWFQHYGKRRGWFEPTMGLALFSVADVALFIAVVWWGVSSLHRMDTIRRQAEEELKQTADKLARSNADLEQFAYVASHDLKEPLRAISGSVQILQQRYHDKNDPESDEVIKHTVDGATRMQRLIDDLLTYSRLTTREAPLVPTDLMSIFDEAKANLESAIRESRAIVTADPLPTVNCDRTQLLQVFQNLIANGIKYKSERTPKIHVSAEDHDGEWLLSIRDNGLGIAPQYAERIFRLFQRLHTRRDYTGTGIGLAVCKKIIERHGGRIWVESEPEEG
ncbi:MAG: sensor histidine kinase, partial [Limisphaerales bacterium]